MARAIVLATASDQPAITASDRLYAEALERRGFPVVGAPWDGPRAAFDGAAAVVIRSTWGYYRTSDAFRDWTEERAAAPCSVTARGGISALRGAPKRELTLSSPCGGRLRTAWLKSPSK